MDAVTEIAKRTAISEIVIILIVLGILLPSNYYPDISICVVIRGGRL